MHSSEASMSTPLGMLLLRCNEHGLTEVGFAADGAVPRRPTDPLLLETMLQLEAYFAGATADFSNLPLAPAGTPFQHRVWSALRAIPPGATRRYGDIATDIGTAARAVGGACRSNPLLLVVPCHRVIARTGSGGFMGAANGPWPQRKQHLLDHERRFFAA
ncbi:MAG TPA: methylated-DNA--[protein]-cysteine S-methyltransferase [Gammaproteobacteria bacterium]|nr:methylated-DNA--[protein]-cysteine S-methyltransferase [Gammaproteobacteria bacterium]HCZ49244.1 methylated-DNA--[protein]-cysteine S-methyltransferase [Gammaproteobacteria bacterium]MCH78682.1 methylated-DNA--[protein]-cysteine S-methyltransferase [Gammaproteobacteria bacterium]